MVSQVPTQSEISTRNRGFIPEETLVVSGASNVPLTMSYRPFWRPVLAGALCVLSIFVFSWYLMLGLHVGVSQTGAIDLGVGAAVWIWATSCIAFFAGGVVASMMSAPSSNPWLKGAVIWALSIPLSLITHALLERTGNLLAELNLPHQGLGAVRVDTLAMYPVQYGFVWSVFITLACGLVCSIIGSITGSENPEMIQARTGAVTSSTPSDAR